MGDLDEISMKICPCRIGMSARMLVRIPTFPTVIKAEVDSEVDI